MKKKLFALLVTLILVFAFSITCFAKESPTGTTIETTTAAETTTVNPNQNTSSTSPKTGVGVTGAFIAVVTAAGVMLVSRKKYAEAE